MTLSDEDIGAYLDGELTAARMTEVEAHLTRSPETLRRMLAIRKTDRRIVAAYDAINDQPLPTGLVDKIRLSASEAPAIGKTQRRAVRKNRRIGLGLLSGPLSWAGLMARPAFQLSLAASIALVIGFGLGGGLSPDSSGRRLAALMTQGAGVVTADSALFAVLESQPSAVPVVLDRGAGVRAMPVLTFAAKDGAYCREFEIAAATASSRGVACRGDRNWTIRVMAAASGAASDLSAAAGDTGTYLPATGADRPVIDHVIGDLIDGAPLGAEQERRLLDRAWTQAPGE